MCLLLIEDFDKSSFPYQVLLIQHYVLSTIYDIQKEGLYKGSLLCCLYDRLVIELSVAGTKGNYL